MADQGHFDKVALKSTKTKRQKKKKKKEWRGEGMNRILGN